MPSTDHQESTGWTGGWVRGKQEENCRVWSLLLHQEHALSFGLSSLCPTPPCSGNWKSGSCSAPLPHTCTHQYLPHFLTWGPLESQPPETWREVAWGSSNHQPPPNAFTPSVTALDTSRKVFSIPEMNLSQAPVTEASQAVEGSIGRVCPHCSPTLEKPAPEPCSPHPT